MKLLFHTQVYNKDVFMKGKYIMRLLFSQVYMSVCLYIKGVKYVRMSLKLTHLLAILQARHVK